jgi:hypothetical protein
MGGYATQCTHTKAAVYSRDAGDERFRVLGVGPSILELAFVPFAYPRKTLLTSDQTVECLRWTPIHLASQGSLLNFGFDTDRGRGTHKLIFKNMINRRESTHTSMG